MVVRRFRNSISARLILWVLLFSVLVTLVGSALQLLVEYGREREAIRDLLYDVDEVHVPGLAAALWVSNRDLLETQLEGIVSLPDIERAEVFEHGRLFAAAGLATSEETVVRSYALNYVYDGELRSIGRLVVTAGLDDVIERLKGMAVRILVIQGLQIFLLAGFLVLLFQAMVTRHLEGLADRLRDMDPTRGFEPLVLDRRPDAPPDELDEVVGAVNDLSHELQAAFDQLRAANADLESELVRRRRAEEDLRAAHQEMERRVMERTEQLGEANRHLYEEVVKRERAKRDLAESRETALALVNATSDLAMLLDREGYVLMVNSRLAKHLGSTPEELKGRHCRDLVDSDVTEARWRAFEECLRTGRPQVMQDERAGRHYVLGFHPVGDESGGTGRVAVFIQDVTEREQAQQLREDMERITRHDLKGPLISFISGVDVLRDEGGLTEIQEEVVELMQESSYHMLDQINLSLELFRMERGEYELTPEEVDLGELAAKIADQFVSMAGSKGVALEVEQPGEAVVCRGEELLLRTLFSNLVKNAVEASPEGGTVSISCRLENGRAAVEIANAGAVPEAMRDKLFEKFATQGKKGGTGLGLYSARLAARVHGGEIGWKSSEEAGTVFTVYLPC